MKLGIFSDTHLGFASGTKRHSDALMQAKQALQILVDEKVDAVLMIGDFFDEEIPRQETWHDAFELLEIALKAGKTNLKISVEKRDAKPVKKGFDGIPVIAIHGTHEHRGKDYKNALEILEKAGFLIHLHASKALLESEKEKVCVFGLSGVPEKHAKDALKAWNPKPEKDCLNVLLLHQSFTEFLPFDDEMTATLSLEDLPKGFDFVINGHLHWSLEKKLGDSMFLMPGSTITTQLKSHESSKQKGVMLLDSKTKKVSFKEIPKQRQVFYEKLKFEKAEPAKVLEKAEAAISGFLKKNTSSLEPLIRVKCTGSLAKGFSSSDISFAGIEEKFSGRALLSLDKDFSSEAFKQTIAELRELQKQKKSISQTGLDILEKKLQETSFGNAFDVRQIFELLSEGKNEEVEKLLQKPRKD